MAAGGSFSGGLRGIEASAASGVAGYFSGTATGVYATASVGASGRAGTSRVGAASWATGATLAATSKTPRQRTPAGPSWATGTTASRRMAETEEAHSTRPTSASTLPPPSARRGRPGTSPVTTALRLTGLALAGGSSAPVWASVSAPRRRRGWQAPSRGLTASRRGGRPPAGRRLRLQQQHRFVRLPWKGTYKVFGSGSVSFAQNHPYDRNRVVVYSAPEGDEVATYTRGTARLVNGEARVPLARPSPG